MKASEECPCGARFSFELPTDITGYSNWAEWLVDRVKEWRESHRHEPVSNPDTLPEQPYFVESGSSHERRTPDWDDEPKHVVGFAPNP